MSPSPTRYHQEISRNIESILLKFLEHNPIGEVFDAPFEVYFGEHDQFGSACLPGLEISATAVFRRSAGA